MIYFLVNNDYQLIDANRHTVDLRIDGLEASIILVPHSLQCEPPTGVYKNIFLFESPVKGRRWFASWIRYFLVPHKITEINPVVGDTLVMYTEYELVNHLILKLFRSAGCKVVLMEDGGIGTYLPFSKIKGQVLSWREQLTTWSIKCLPGLRDTVFKKINNVVFQWRPDNQIDLLCIYRNLVIARKIKTTVIQGGMSALNLTPVMGRVIFLNECIYDHYQDPEAYISGLKKIIKALSVGYSDIYFKYHPRDQAAWRDLIRRRVLHEYPSVKVIEESQPIELLLESYAPEALASYFSTPLLNLSGTGIEPLFLYHLLGDLCEQPIFSQLTNLLHQWRYQFAKDWSGVRTGYQSKISFWNAGQPELPTLADSIRIMHSDSR